MSRLRGIAAMLRTALGRSAAESRMQDEFRFHLEMETEQLKRSGLATGEARRRALVRFGGIERHKEDMRDGRGARWIEVVVQDVRYAARVLRRNPGVTIATTLTFALGIGAATAIFSVVYGVVLRPLPYRAPDRLAVLWERKAASGAERNVVSVPNFEAWRERSRSFSTLAALVPMSLTLAGDGAPERIAGAEVSPGYFATLGVRPALGRAFEPREEIAGNADVAILSDGLWRRRFGADRAVLGRTFPVEGRSVTIVGVMPPGFDPPRIGWLGEQQMWMPFTPTPSNRGWGRFLLVVGRLRDGVTPSAAQSELRGVADRLARDVKEDEGWSANVVPLAREIAGDVRTSMLVILGAVGLLLLMAVGNVATLTIASTRRRAHELAVRRAIGATRPRLVRQLLTQSAMLGVLGTIVGILAALGGVRLLVAAMPTDIPRVGDIRVDAPVLFVTSTVAIVATLAFGIVAALRGGRANVGSVRGDGEIATTRSSRSRGRIAARARGGSLIVSEIALGLVLAVLAALMVRSVVALRAVDLGFVAERTVAARVTLPNDRYAGAERQAAFFNALVRRAQAIPGVRSVSTASARPFSGIGPATTVVDVARPLAPGVEPPVTDVRYVDAEFFRTLRIPLLAGTSFAPRERSDGPARVVINRAMARTLWPDDEPARAIGRSVRIEIFNHTVAQIIGIAGDVHLLDARTAPRATAYLSLDRFPSERRDLLLRTDDGAAGADAGAFATAIRASVAALDPGLPVYSIEPLGQLVDASLARDRFTALLLGAFATVALLLAAVGIFGVCAADVARRRSEIGIRLALGGRPSDIVMLELRRMLRHAAVGVVLGVLVALGVARLMRPLLFGVASEDPTSFATVTAVLVGVASLATLIPAMRAARRNPLSAIRS